MPVLEINAPFETDQPTITLEIDPNKPLARGRHVFQLEVVDDSANVSEPVKLVVIVADKERPTAVLEGPQVADFGKPFKLSGEKSFDIGGSIKTYRFTYLGPEL
jgi:hypothetical protein